MLAVLLLILKILGIVLLSLLGIVLFIILIILFVPVRYNIRASKDDKEDSSFYARAKVTWLLHIVNVLVNYPSDELLRVRILLFKIFPGNKKEKPIRSKSANKKDKIQTADPVEDIVSSSSDTVSYISDEETSGIEKIDENNDNKDSLLSEETTSDNRSKYRERKTVKQRFHEFITGLKSKTDDLKKRIFDIRDNTERYISIYNSDEFQSSFSLCKSKLIKILKSILPRRIKGNVQFGKADSPDTVGMVFSIYSLFYPKIGKQFILNPNFEKDILTGDVLIKGRIFVFVIIFAGIRIYFDKNVKKLLKMLKKEN